MLASATNLPTLLAAAPQVTGVHSLELLFQGTTFLRLLEGLWITIWVALLSMAISILCGTLLGLLMTRRNRFLVALTRLYVEFFRLMPQIVLLFVVFFDTTRVWGWNLPGVWAAVIVFSLWGTAEMGDLVRGAVESVPRHFIETARALGLRPPSIYRRIVAPLALRQLVPQTVNLTTRMIKTTPLITMIGVVEVLRVGQQVIDANRFNYPQAALWIYGVVFFLYFLICYVISLGARALERRAASYA